MTSRVPPPGEVWVDARLAIGASPIDGRGLFFSEDIGAGTTVIRFGGRLVSTVELDGLIAAAEADASAPYVDTVTIGADVHLVLPPNTVAHFGNHGCDPTMARVGPYEVATCRDVAAGEEATIDYGTLSGAGGLEMACRCGATTCRGVITSTEWPRGDAR